MRSAELAGAIRPRSPFDFSLALAYLGRSPHEVLDVVQDRRYRRAVHLDGSVAVVDVEASGTVDDPRLACRVWPADNGETTSPAPPDSRLARAGRQLVERCFRTNEDHPDFETLRARDPVFANLLDRLRGARAMLMPTPFEALVWAILGQQINVAFAYKLKRVLVERYGERVRHDGRIFNLFPRADRLASLTVDELRAVQFSRQKAEYIVRLAQLEMAGGIAWDRLSASPTGLAVPELMSLRGVGRWTAEYVCMRGLGHRDVLPAADLGLRAAIGRAYRLGRHASEAEVRELAERWAGWRSHAAFCWWFTLAPGLDGGFAGPVGEIGVGP